MYQLYAVPERQQCCFTLTDKLPPKPKHVPAELPFGLQLPAAKRKPKGPKRSCKAGARKPRPATTPVTKSACVVIDSDSQTDHGMNGSGSDSSDCTSDDGQGDRMSAAQGEAEIDLNKESDCVAPVSSTAAEVEASLPQLEQELNREEDLRSKAAEAIQANRPAPRASSFFAKELGLAEGAVAVSARSVCLNCKLPIQKGSIRFSWHHSLYRPASWVHAACVCQLVRSTGLHEGALRRLSEISRQGASSSSSSASAVSAEVSRMAAQLHAALLSQEV